MKKILALVSLSFFLFACNSAKKTTAPVVTETIPPLVDTLKSNQPVFESLRDSASYAMGIFLINFYSQQGITDINPQMVARAIEDAQKKMPMSLTDGEANTAIMNYINQAQYIKSKANIEAGEKLLEENKKKPGIVTTATGLQYEVITMGTGSKPTLEDSVLCHYRGTFVDGTPFDDSYSRGEPVKFKTTGVIRGWTEALQLMPKGSKWKLYVPYQLGYGVNDYFSIPGGSLLIFEIELLDVISAR